MKAVWWMTAVSTLSAGAVSIVSDAPAEVWLGMIAPLAVVIGSWIAMRRAYDKRPERVTSIMVAAFFAKLVFFGAYVAFVMGVLHVRPVPFAASFVNAAKCVYRNWFPWVSRSHSLLPDAWFHPTP